MKVFKAKEFGKLPKGTIFTKFEPCMFGDMMIKGETRWMADGDMFDFFYSDLTCCLITESSEEWTEKMFDMANNGTSYPLTVDELSRDGFYNMDQLYAVYSKDDIKQLVIKLSSLI